MQYKILADDVEVADFEFEADRDICLEALKIYFPDATWTITNKKSII